MIHPRIPHQRRRAAGFSLVELLVATLIFSLLMAIAFTALSEVNEQHQAEQNLIDTRQEAQVVVQMVAEAVQRAGLGVDRRDPYNSAAWQRSIVYAGSHALSFNADIDQALGALDTTQTIVFPTGETYRGESSFASQLGAETYVWTIDANADSAVTLDDRIQAAAGSFNPATQTTNPHDFALFRRAYGFNGSTTVSAQTPLTASLFTNATSAVKYPDNSSPEPLFTYWLTEDLNRDNRLDPAECVVLPCPPSTSRPPRLYLWGDTDFNGALSEAEKEALRTLPVGAAAWSRNRLAPGGTYSSTALSTAFTAGQSSTLQVTNAAVFGPGEFIQIGTGTTTERLTIRGIDTAPDPDTITVSSKPVYSQSSGTTVKILSTTLLRAIRAIDIQFGAITPEKVIEASIGSGPIGRNARLGTRGLEYKVMPIRRRIELVNLQSAALIRNSGTFEGTPASLTVQPYCGGSIQSEMTLMLPLQSSTSAPISFLVRDSTGNPVPGSIVAFPTLPTKGTLSSQWVITDANGVGTFQYTASGIGDETLTAYVGSQDAEGNWSISSTKIDMKVKQMSVAVAADCLSTITPRTPSPSTTFSMQVDGPTGKVSDVPVELVLEFDPTYLPDPSLGFSTLEAELLIEGVPVGYTDPTTGSLIFPTTTGFKGVITGAVRLTKDLTQAGAVLHVKARGAGSNCATLTAEVQRSISFYRLQMQSLQPAGPCDSATPCIVNVGAPAPSAEATLTVGSKPVPGGSIQFSKTDSSATGITTVLSPPSSWITDANGKATVSILTLDGAAITPGTPLQTVLDATANSPTCASGNIAANRDPLYFRFDGPASGCTIDLPQTSVSVPNYSNPYQLCLSVQNTNPPFQCPVRIKGLAFTVFQPDGITPDPNFKVARITGGTMTSLRSCSSTGAQVLFDTTCNQSVPLPNGTPWTFQNVGFTCSKPNEPPNPVRAQYFFNLNSVVWNTPIAGLSPKRRLDVTAYYECTGTCGPSPTLQRTFQLQTP